MSRIPFSPSGPVPIVIGLAIAAVVSHLFLWSSQEKREISDKDFSRAVEEVWLYESSPADRYQILAGLSALECIEVKVCSLTHDEPVMILSE